MAASLYLGNLILDAVLRGQQFTMIVPTRVYVSLHTSDPGKTGDNEVTTAEWPSYRRLDPANGNPVETGFTVPVDKQVKATGDLTFGLLDGPVPLTISDFGIWDSPIGGNCLILDQLATAKIFYPGDDAAIRSDKFTVTVL